MIDAKINFQIEEDSMYLTKERSVLPQCTLYRQKPNFERWDKSWMWWWMEIWMEASPMEMIAFACPPKRTWDRRMQWISRSLFCWHANFSTSLRWEAKAESRQILAVSEDKDTTESSSGGGEAKHSVSAREKDCVRRRSFTVTKYILKNITRNWSYKK